MGQMRGIVMIVLGVLALYRGWTLNGGQHTVLAYALGALALALGAWHLSRKTPQR